MPIERCGKNNEGYRWGNSGKCYDNKEDALKQMRAIKVSQQSKGEKVDTELKEIDEEILKLAFEKALEKD